MMKKIFNRGTAPMLGVFSLALFFVLPLRAYQYVRVIEPITGFYKNKSFTITALYLVLALALLVIYFMSLAKKNEIKFVKNVGKSLPIGLTALYLAFALAVDSKIMVENFNSLYYGASSSLQQGSSQEISNLTMRAGAVPMLLEAIFAVIAALYFLFLAFDSFSGRDRIENLKLLALSPLAWSIFRILHRFMRTISFLRVSELFFELVCLVFLMLFFLSFAQLNARINHKGADWRMVAYGLNAALVSLLCFVPRFALLILGKSDKLAVLSSPQHIDLALAIFIVVFILVKVKFSAGKET